MPREKSWRSQYTASQLRITPSKLRTEQCECDEREHSDESHCTDKIVHCRRRLQWCNQNDWPDSKKPRPFDWYDEGWDRRLSGFYWHPEHGWIVREKGKWFVCELGSEKHALGPFKTMREVAAAAEKYRSERGGFVARVE